MPVLPTESKPAVKISHRPYALHTPCVTGCKPSNQCRLNANRKVQSRSSRIAIIRRAADIHKQLRNIRDMKPTLRHVVFPVSFRISVALTRVVRPIGVTWIPGPSRVWGPLAADRVHLLEGQSEDVWTRHHGRFTCCGIW